jgi:ABC-type phosphate transport system permease subunit
MNDDHEDRNKRIDRLITIIILVTVILIIGTLGFRIYEGDNWIDAFYHGSITFTSLGVPTPAQTHYGKIFISLYSTFSIIFIISFIALLVGTISPTIS